MIRQILAAVACSCGTLLMFGCQGLTPLDPTPPPITSSGEAALGATLISPAASLGALALYDVSLDLESLAAEVSLRAGRQAQENDDVYLLPVDNFLRPDSFVIRALQRHPDVASSSVLIDRTPRLELQWEFTHPFQSSAVIPRADLGFSGIACFLFDVNTASEHQYFASDANVILNESLALNADGYFQPKALLDLTGFTANTFPYQTLVDELGGDVLSGNRFLPGTNTRIENLWDPRGNYGLEGWQSGPTHTWTGFDILHQGQAVRRTLQLDLATIEAAGRVDFVVAIFDKYVDPKSATPGFQHRLPADPPDLLGHFGYRYPHGCWDVSRVRFMGETQGLVHQKESVTTVRFRVRDWDARAEVSSESDLSLETDPMEVLASSVGTPSLRVCVPLAYGGSAGFAPWGATPTDDDSLLVFNGGDPERDSGLARDELFYEGTVYAPTGVSGPATRRIWGVVEVADAEVDIPAYQTVLDGMLTPITTNLPRNVTYQVFPLSVQPRSTAVGFAISGHGAGAQTTTAVAYDNSGNAYVGGNFAGTINLGGTDYASNGNTDCFVAKYDPAGAFQWVETWGGTGADEVTCLLISEDNPLTLMIGGSFSGTVEFDPPGGSSRTAAFIDMYVVQRLSSNGSFVSVRTYGSPGYDVVTSLADNGNRPEADYVLGGWIQGAANFGGGHALDTGGSLQGVVVGLDRITGNAKSAYLLESDDYSAVNKMALFTDGQVAVGGVYQGTLQSGVGPETSRGGADGFLMRVRLDNAAGASTSNFLLGFGDSGEDSIGGVVAYDGGTAASIVFAFNGDSSTRAGVAHVPLSSLIGTGVEFLEVQDGTVRINDLVAIPGSTASDGTYYVTGVKSGLAYFTTNPFPGYRTLPGFATSGTGTEAFVWKFGTPGPKDGLGFHTDWAVEFGGSGSEGGTAIAASSTAVLVGGYYDSAFDIAPGVINALLPTTSGPEAFATQIPGDGNW